MVAPKEHPNLSHEELLSLVAYDKDTGGFLWIGARRRKLKHLGILKPGGYYSCYIKGRDVKSHRLAWFYHYGEWPDGYIDHINGDRADNRISNLRLATPQQNQWNNPGRKKKASGLPKGVTKCSIGYKYQATIKSISGKYIYLGIFSTPEEASSKYKEAASLIHGEYAAHLSRADVLDTNR